MATIKYKIVFHTEWHCGSGLAAGADLDSLVVKDENGVPFVPGKTMKGLVREATFDLLSLGHSDNSLFIESFGEGPKEKTNQEDKTYIDLVKGKMFFKNATLEESVYNDIVDNNVQRFLFRKKASTAIDEKTGIAKEHSLRSMQTTIPLTLMGEIIDVPEKIACSIVESLGMIKNMGQGRNRGLGRCTIVGVVEGGNK